MIFIALGAVTALLSHLTSNYTYQIAVDAQTKTLTKVIEVVSKQVLNKIKNHNQDLAMKLSYDRNILSAASENNAPGDYKALIKLIDEPFIHGFVGYSKIELVKIRIYNKKLELIAESTQGIKNIEQKIDPFIFSTLNKRSSTDRLKAINSLWISSQGPLYSTIVPLGGLRLIGYIEVISDPAFNLPEVGEIIQSPIKVIGNDNKIIGENPQQITNHHLPISFILNTSNGRPAFKIIAYENIETLNEDLDKSLQFTVSTFLSISLITLLIALAIFSRSLFIPVTNMVKDINKVKQGKLHQKVNETGLKEFYILANAFNSMTDQLKLRTDSLYKLLDMNDNALLCFDHDKEVVYFNKKATEVFGYDFDETSDLDISDLFLDDIEQILHDVKNSTLQPNEHTFIPLQVKHKSGEHFNVKGIFHVINNKDESGLAIALEPQDKKTTTDNNESPNTLHQDTDDALNSLSFIAQSDRRFMRRRSTDFASNNESPSSDTKDRIREQVVKVMNNALACWTQDLNKTKIELAEESKIWPVYIDKSTPTTRTLDKYLSISQSPKNPRTQRVIDTAEFVIKNIVDKESPKKTEFQASLDELQQTISGLA